MDTKALEVILGLKDNMSPGMASASRGARTMTGVMNIASAAVMRLVAAFAAFVALRNVIRFMGESITLAQQQTKAITTLNAALIASGQYTAEASVQLQNYATALQGTLGIGDEVTLETMGIVEGLTKLSSEALPQAMNAVVQISALYQTDYKAASILLGKTLTSNLNAFQRYGIEIDMAGTAQERLNEIVDKTSAGMAIAEAQANTYEGAMRKLDAAWGDYKEIIGGFIEDNPAVVTAINFLTRRIQVLTANVDSSRDAHLDLVSLGFYAVISGASRVLSGLDYLAVGFASIKLVVIDTAREILTAWNSLLKMLVNTDAAFDTPFIRAGLLNDAIVENEAALHHFNQQQVDVVAGIADSAANIIILEASLASLRSEMANSVGVTHEASNAFDELAEIVAGSGSGGGGGDGPSVEEALTRVYTKVDLVALAFRNLTDAIKDMSAAADASALESMTARIGKAMGIEEFMQPREPHFVEKERNEWRMGFVRGSRKKPGMATSGWGALGRNENLWNLAGGVAQGAMQGQSGGELFGGLLGAAGGIVGGPWGIGLSLLGGLFGKKKNRGETKANPVYVYKVNDDELLLRVLNIVLPYFARSGSGGMSDIDTQIRSQNLGYAGG